MGQKISKKELVNLIKEEVKKAIKIKSLNEEKSRIEKQIRLLKENFNLDDFNYETKSYNGGAYDYITIDNASDFEKIISNALEIDVPYVVNDELIQFEAIMEDDGDYITIGVVISDIDYEYTPYERTTLEYEGTDESLEVYEIFIGNVGIFDIVKKYPNYKDTFKKLADKMADYLFEKRNDRDYDY
jgi:hypothetical protein